MRRSSSCLTSTASLTLMSGSVRDSQALLMELGVISENRARNTWMFCLTRRDQSRSQWHRVLKWQDRKLANKRYAERNKQNKRTHELTIFADVDDLAAYVFSLTITIGPDHQSLALSRLSLQGPLKGKHDVSTHCFQKKSVDLNEGEKNYRTLICTKFSGQYFSTSASNNRTGLQLCL